ncbi:hypothetical protein E2C01_061649 [Portunus trituberculatus]|uniref:Uncharacterized protein n=1 Tax=Portunus trituberculatus TaxID=210409 RepID=A0A5B7H8Q8_PORTR|nr:hypothetical protein [Portunus trituberculatus]
MRWWRRRVRVFVHASSVPAQRQSGRVEHRTPPAGRRSGRLGSRSLVHSSRAASSAALPPPRLQTPDAR